MLLSRTSDLRRDRGWPLAHALVLLALVLGYTLAYRWNTLVPDTARDIVQGLAITGGDWPADGPLIADRWVLSPLWFYLVAALASVAHSPATLALLVGLLAATKIPLAWLLGRRFVGNRGGLLFAALVALPGWTVLEHLVWSHTNFVQATALLALLALARWREAPSDLRAFLALLALGIALQAHPTNLVAALPFVVLLDPARLRGSARGIAVGALALALLGAPSLLHELGNAVELNADVATPFPAPFAALGGMPLLFVQIVLLPQQAPAFLIAPHWPFAALVLRAASGAIVAAGLASVLFELIAGRRRFAGLLVAWLLAAIVLVAMLRPWTPAYMAFAPQLAASALLAFGLASLIRHRSSRAASVVTGAVVVVALAASGTWIAARLRDAESGMQRLPRMALIDVRQPAKGMDPPNVMFTAADHGRVDRAACRGELRAPIAADLAAMLLMGQGAPLVLADCPAESWPVIGAGAGALAGVPLELAERAGLGSDATVASFALVPVARGVHAVPDRRLGYVTAYPPYSFFALPPRSVAQHVELAPGERLLASNLLVFFNPWEPAASVAGAQLAAVARSENTLVYACPDLRQACAVDLSLTARQPDWLQAMVVRAR